MKPLTPTATAVLDTLTDGPATTPDLRTRIACGRSTLDKTLAELHRNALVTRLPEDHPDHPNHWTLTADLAAPDPDRPAVEELGLLNGDQPGTREGEPTGDARVEQEATSQEVVDFPDHDDTPDTDTPTAEPEPETAGREGGAQESASDHGPADETAPAPPDEDIKICRGCQSQMPKTCPTCWNKTSSYCGPCRRTMPTRSRNGTPEILSNGLPKLGRGQLAELVQDVMRTHPVPDHLGITGWTSGRIAVYLPGRSTGAIGNVLDKLATAGLAAQLGDNPRRYRLHATQPTPEEATTDMTAAPTRSDTVNDTAGAATQMPTEEALKDAVPAPETEHEFAGS